MCFELDVSFVFVAIFTWKWCESIYCAWLLFRMSCAIIKGWTRDWNGLNERKMIQSSSLCHDFNLRRCSKGGKGSTLQWYTRHFVFLFQHNYIVMQHFLRSVTVLTRNTVKFTKSASQTFTWQTFSALIRGYPRAPARNKTCQHPLRERVQRIGHSHQLAACG